jgi:hypothetical protein
MKLERLGDITFGIGAIFLFVYTFWWLTVKNGKSCKDEHRCDVPMVPLVCGLLCIIVSYFFSLGQSIADRNIARTGYTLL